MLEGRKEEMVSSVEARSFGAGRPSQGRQRDHNVLVAEDGLAPGSEVRVVKVMIDGLYGVLRRDDKISSSGGRPTRAPSSNALLLLNLVVIGPERTKGWNKCQ